MEHHKITRDSITWLAYLLLAFYAYLLNVFGPITPFLKDELHLSYTISSLHFTAFATGILLVGWVGQWPIRRLGRQRALWSGAFGISLGAFILIVGRTPMVTIGASFFMGLVGSLILVIVPSLLADNHPQSRSMVLVEANVIAALFSAAAPLFVGWSANSAVGWRLALGLAALTPIIMISAFKRGGSAPMPEQTEQKTMQAAPLPKRYWFFWTAIVLAVSVEFCMVFWSADFIENILAIQKAQAAQSVSLFLAGMIIGRLAGSRLVNQFDTRHVVIFSNLLATIGFATFWLSRISWLSLPGLFVAGLGVASLYPLILSLAIGAAPGQAVKASARATLASGSAIFALPLALGRMADLTGIYSAFSLVAFLLAGIFILVVFSGN